MKRINVFQFTVDSDECSSPSYPGQAFWTSFSLPRKDKAYLIDKRAPDQPIPSLTLPFQRGGDDVTNLNHPWLSTIIIPLYKRTDKAYLIDKRAPDQPIPSLTLPFQRGGDDVTNLNHPWLSTIIIPLYKRRDKAYLIDKRENKESLFLILYSLTPR
jgi:hypothetical protein